MHRTRTALGGWVRLAMAASLSAGLAAMTSSHPAWADHHEEPQALEEVDRVFIEASARGHLFEIQLGRLLSQRAQSERVRSYAEHLANDHQESLEALSQIASARDHRLPEDMSSAQARTVREFRIMAEDEIDRRYLEEMVREHREDLEKYQTHAEEAKDPALRRYAEMTVPVLEAHLRQAQNLLREREAAAEL